MDTSGYTYTCAGGESFDTIARDLWGDERYAAELMSINPEHCGKASFRGNEILYLPAIDTPEDEDEEPAAAQSAAPWKE